MLTFVLGYGANSCSQMFGNFCGPKQVNAELNEPEIKGKTVSAKIEKLLKQQSKAAQYSF